MNQQIATQNKPTALSALAARLAVDESIIQNIVVNTLLSAKKNIQPTNEEFATFIAIANEYKLNPLTKEIYAFSNRGTVQVIVSIDGWLKIINAHPQMNGFETIENFDNQGKLLSVTCRIYRKDREHPTTVTEYLAECQQHASEPWKKWPARMLRHKALIQCARYAFGLALLDEDEVERIKYAEKDVTNSYRSENSKAAALEISVDVGFWSEMLESSKDMAAYNEAKSKLMSEFNGNPPTELKQLFSNRFLELAQ